MPGPVSYAQVFPDALVVFTTDGSVEFSLDSSSDRFRAQHSAYLRKYRMHPLRRVFNIRQVHGARVVVAHQKIYECQKIIPHADAVITRDCGVPIAVRTADCLPIFVYDPRTQTIGVIHAGWRSTHKQIVGKTLQLMQRRFGARGSDLIVAFGPALRSCCYEVSEEFLDFFPRDVRARQGRLFFDLAGANQRCLRDWGVQKHQVSDCHICTFCQPGYASYRRDSDKAFRMLSLIMLKDKK